MKIRLDHVSAAESGDYFQVLFEAEEDGDTAASREGLWKSCPPPDGGS